MSRSVLHLITRKTILCQVCTSPDNKENAFVSKFVLRDICISPDNKENAFVSKFVLHLITQRQLLCVGFIHLVTRNNFVSRPVLHLLTKKQLLCPGPYV